MPKYTRAGVPARIMYSDVRVCVYCGGRRAQESDEHDDRCKVCEEMGELLCCDECTSAVHLR